MYLVSELSILDGVFYRFSSIHNVYNRIKEAYALSKDISLRIVSGEGNVLSTSELSLPYQSSFFSDSLILSYEIINPRPDFMDLYCILYEINTLTFHLARGGVFIRGGLAYGELYHKSDICFGKALVEAVALESEVAIYPRIAISPNIFDDMSDNFPYKP